MLAVMEELDDLRRGEGLRADSRTLREVQPLPTTFTTLVQRRDRSDARVAHRREDLRRPWATRGAVGMVRAQAETFSSASRA